MDAFDPDTDDEDDDLMNSPHVHDKEEEEEEPKTPGPSEEEEEEEGKASGTPTRARQRHHQQHVTPVSRFVYELSSQAFRDYTNLFSGAVHQSQSLEQTMQWQSEGKSFERVLHQMIISRGFVVFTLSNLSNGLSDTTNLLLTQVLRQNKTMMVAFNQAGHLLLSVYANAKSKLGIETARQIQQVCAKINPVQLLIITQEGITPAAKKLFVDLVKNTQFFLTTELEKNYSLHKLVPRQIPLDAKQTAELLDKYSIQLANLPKMNKTDPIAKFFGWPSGTVVKSIRKFGEALEPHIYYRVVK